MWDDIIYPFPNFSGVDVEVWEWISNFISHITGHIHNFFSCYGVHCVQGSSYSRFPPTIQTYWKFHFALVQFLDTRLHQSCAGSTTK